MSTLMYRTGNAAVPSFTGPDVRCVIAHVVNNIGAWGKGFTKSLDERYPRAKAHYLSWAQGDTNMSFGLGRIYTTPVSMADEEEWDGTVIAHLCAQDGLPSRDNPRPFKLTALDTALTDLARHLRETSPRPIGDLRVGRHRLSIQMPRIGAGLGRGDWREIAPLIEKRLCPIAPVTVIDREW